MEDLLKRSMAGKVVVVTGANTGIGLVTSRQLAKQGATVVLCCRDAAKGAAALADCQSVSPQPSAVTLQLMDLSSLASVAAAASQLLSAHPTVDVLLNNAGVMACPEAASADGHEMQIATNHLGHFALTLALLPALARAPQARVITVSSSAHQMGPGIDTGDLNWKKRGYGAWNAYGASKLANILMTQELSKRLHESGLNRIVAVSLHPGVVKTDLVRHQWSFVSWLLGMIQIDSWAGSQSSLACVLMDHDKLVPAAFYDQQNRGPIKTSHKQAGDEKVAAALWSKSEELTGVTWAGAVLAVAASK